MLNTDFGTIRKVPNNMNDPIMALVLCVHVGKRKKLSKIALAGNRTRASRVAGENSTTEPPALDYERRFVYLHRNSSAVTFGRGAAILD